MFSSNVLHFAFTAGHLIFLKSKTTNLSQGLSKPACASESPVRCLVLFLKLLSELYPWTPRFGRSGAGLRTPHLHVLQVTDGLSEFETTILDSIPVLLEKSMNKSHS